MPRAFVPHKSGAHRLACLSLYRALLRQCEVLSKSTLSHGKSHPPNTLRNIVRYRFKKDRKLVAPSQIVNGLKAGEKVLDHLQACNTGSSRALRQLTTLVESTLSLAESTSAYRTRLAPAGYSVPPHKLGRVASIQAHWSKANHERHVDSKPILERPLPLDQIASGRRKVPYLVAAHGVPFLRYGKPQPISLGRYLRQQRASDNKKWGQREAMLEILVLAELEDEWDLMLERQHEILDEKEEPIVSVRRSRPGKRNWSPMQEDLGPNSWTKVLMESIDLLDEQFREKTRKRSVIGRQMWEVVVKEREQAEQEKAHRKEKRKAERLQADSKIEESVRDVQLVDSGSAAHSGLTDGLAAASDESG